MTWFDLVPFLFYLAVYTLIVWGCIVIYVLVGAGTWLCITTAAAWLMTCIVLYIVWSSQTIRYLSGELKRLQQDKEMNS